MLSRIRDVLSKCYHMLTLAIVELVIGIFLLITPAGLAVAILWIIGILMIANGVYRCIAYFKEPTENSQKGFKLATGAFLLVAGLFFLFNVKFVVGIFPVLSILYGVLVMNDAFLKIEIMVTRLREKKINWYVMAASLLFTIIAMIILYSNVGFVGAGILLILAAGLDALCYFNDIGKVEVPTLKDLIEKVLALFKKDKKATSDSAPVPDFKNGDTLTNIPFTAETPAAEPTVQPVDPADEDMSWANVPQLQFPTDEEKEDQ